LVSQAQSVSTEIEANQKLLKQAIEDFDKTIDGADNDIITKGKPNWSFSSVQNINSASTSSVNLLQKAKNNTDTIQSANNQVLIIQKEVKDFASKSKDLETLKALKKATDTLLIEANASISISDILMSGMLTLMDLITYSQAQRDYYVAQGNLLLPGESKTEFAEAKAKFQAARKEYHVSMNTNN